MLRDTKTCKIYIIEKERERKRESVCVCVCKIDNEADGPLTLGKDVHPHALIKFSDCKIYRLSSSNRSGCASINEKER